MTKKSPLLKVFIWIALILICITALSTFIMYFWMSITDHKCDEWYARNETNQQCEEITVDTWDNEIIETETEIDTQESCEAQSGTWLEANQVCILPDE